MTSAAPSLDEQMMRRALSLAIQGRGSVEPNPMVGCVIARGECVIGEGFHQKYRQRHAEPNALAACTEHLVSHGGQRKRVRGRIRTRFGRATSAPFT